MTAGYDVRLPRPGETEVVDRLLEEWNGAERVARRRRWMERNPHGAPRTWYLSEPGSEEAVATTALFPRRFTVRGNDAVGAIGGDAYVRPDHRRKGLAKLLHRATQAGMQDEGVDFMFGPPFAANLGALKKAGAVVVGDLRYYTRPLRAASVIGRLGGRRGRRVMRFLAWIADPFLHAIDTLFSRAPRLESVTQCGSEFDALWTRARRVHAVAGVRDAAYLRWRFLEASEPATVIVWRDGDALRGWAAVVRLGDRLFLVDLLVGRLEDARALVRGVVAYGRTEGCIEIQTRLNPHTAYGRAMGSTGFVRGRTRSPFQVLSPVPRPDLYHASGWHLTYADEDAESWRVWFETRCAAPPRSRPVRVRRVLYLADMLDGVHAGTEGQLDELIRRLPATWKPSLWVLQRANALARSSLSIPIRALEVPSLKSPLFAARLKALAGAVRSARIDLIHAMHADASMVAPLLGALADVPVITSRRDLGYWQTPRTVEVLRRSDRYADVIAANAIAVARRTVDVEQASPAQLRIVPNGHPVARFEAAPDPTLLAELGIPPDAPVVGLLANFRALKRPRDLVDAVARLHGKHPDLHALFIGTGPGRTALEHYARSKGVGARVKIHGVIGDVIPVVKHLTIGALCSESEGLSNAIIEYMACGLPVVATRVGGNPELVDEGESGLLYEPGDVPALAAALDRLLSDPDAARRMGRAGRARYEDRYRVDRMVAETLDCYEKLLAAEHEDGGLCWEILDEPDAVEAIAPEWERLLGPNQFFASPDWVLTWLRWSGARPCVPVARDASGALQGLLPLAWSGGGTLALCGQDLGADHLDVVAADGRGEAVARGALRQLASLDWRRIHIRHLAEDSALRAALRGARGGFPYGERLATVCPYLRAEGDWDAFVKLRFKRRRRSALRRGVRRFFDRPAAGVRRVERPEDVAQAVASLFELHGRRFEARGAESAFHGEALQAFHTRLAERLARKERLYLAFLETAGTPAAALYGFRFGGKFYYFQSGMDPDYAASSPGEVLLTVAIRDEVFGQGLDEYDFLDGDEPFKLAWATGQRRLFDVEVFPPTLRGRARCVLGGVREIAKGEVRRWTGRRAQAPTATAR